jgi:molybdate transport system ATP-binding protein
MPRLEIQSRVEFPGFRLAVDTGLPLEGITGLFGPSGHGKSTLLRVIAGLQHRSRGRLAFDGEIWQDDRRRIFLPPHRRGVGFVFQDAGLFPHLTVRGNLRYAEQRAPAARPELAFERVVGFLDLGRLLDRRPAGLSGGERQRVAIGRALLTQPRLLMMDEPLSALDLKRKAEIIPYIERLRAETAVPVLYVTHSIEELSRVAGSVVLLSEGQVAAVGSIEEIMQRLDLHPLTGRFEAGSVLDARVLGHDRKYALTVLEIAGQQLRMPEVAAPAGSSLRIRVRARDVALALGKPREISIRNVLSGRIAAIEVEAGAFAEVSVDIGGPLLRARITRESVDALGLAPPRPVFALIKSVALDRRLLASSSHDQSSRAGSPTAQAPEQEASTNLEPAWTTRAPRA